MRCVMFAGLLAACGIDTGTRNVHLAIDADFNDDGRVDHAKLSDDRDGFRHTFAYLEIWLAGHEGYETAKFKDGRWIWIDHAKYSNLAWLMRMHGY
jgi:hypothetical protein